MLAPAHESSTTVHKYGRCRQKKTLMEDCRHELAAEPANLELKATRAAIEASAAALSSDGGDIGICEGARGFG